MYPCSIFFYLQLYLEKIIRQGIYIFAPNAGALWFGGDKLRQTQNVGAHAAPTDSKQFRLLYGNANPKSGAKTSIIDILVISA